MASLALVTLACLLAPRAGLAQVGRDAVCSGTWSAPIKLWPGASGGQGFQVEGRPELIVGGSEVYAVASLTRDPMAPAAARGLLTIRVGGGSLGAPSGGSAFMHPRVALDRTGGLHMVWAELADPATQREPPSRPRAGRVLHAEYRNGRWSRAEQLYEAPDIWWNSGGDSDLVVDSAGRLHVAFNAYPSARDGTLVHARSGSREWRVTQFAKGPAVPSASPGGRGVVPLNGGGGQPRLAVGPGGRLYLASIAAALDLADYKRLRGNANSVWFWHSENGGTTWEAPVLVSFSGRQRATEPQLLTAGGDTLHLLWGKHLKGTFLPDAIWHSVSTDRGVTWSRPAEIRPPGEPRMLHGVRGVISPDGAVHMTFVVGPGAADEAAFYTRWNGRSWTDPAQLPPAPRVYASDIAFDRTGRLHMLWSHIAPEASGDWSLFYAVRSACRTGS